MSKTTLESILSQYEKNSDGGKKPKVSNEDRLKKYFTEKLRKGENNTTKAFRILTGKEGGSPFQEIHLHEREVNHRYEKIYCNKLNDEGYCPLCEAEEALKMDGSKKAKDMAKEYTARKWYVVKGIDRDNEDDGVKFWRFKHNWKGDGTLDKIIPIFQKRGDITNVTEGRDLTLMLKSVPLPNGKGNYTVISMVMADDQSALSTETEKLKEWTDNAEGWTDVYSQKPVEYLDAVSKGETPRWNNDLKKYQFGDSTVETIQMTQTTTSTTVDPQANTPTDEDLPF